MKVYDFTLSVTQNQYVSWTAFKIVAASLEAMGAFKIVLACFSSSR